jgi:hypothetical protein
MLGLNPNLYTKISVPQPRPKQNFKILEIFTYLLLYNYLPHCIFVSLRPVHNSRYQLIYRQVNGE